MANFSYEASINDLRSDLTEKWLNVIHYLTEWTPFIVVSISGPKFHFISVFCFMMRTFEAEITSATLNTTALCKFLVIPNDFYEAKPGTEYRGRRRLHSMVCVLPVWRVWSVRVNHGRSQGRWPLTEACSDKPDPIRHSPWLMPFILPKLHTTPDRFGNWRFGSGIGRAITAFD